MIKCEVLAEMNWLPIDDEICLFIFLVDMSVSWNCSLFRRSVGEIPRKVGNPWCREIRK
jgi:hypothetical protein